MSLDELHIRTASCQFCYLSFSLPGMWWLKELVRDKIAGQYIYISPQKKVIILRSGFDYGIPSSRWLRWFYQLADSL